MRHQLWCAPGVHLARVDDDLVILNLGTDSYLCLTGAAASVEYLPPDLILTDDGDVASELQALGLAADQPPSPPRRGITPAGRDLILPEHPSRRDTLHAGFALATATHAFRGKSLTDLIHAKETCPGRRMEVSEGRLGELVAAARKARPWIPFEGECLQRSFQLRCYLASCGITVDWIFGVRTWPFAAHCWLQTGDLLVGDRLDRVSRFTPIMKA